MKQRHTVAHASTQLVKNVGKLLKITWEEDKTLFVQYFASAFLGAVLLFGVYFVYKMMIDQVSNTVEVTASNATLLIIGTFLFFEYLSRFVNFTFNQYYFDYFIKAKLQNALTRRFMEKLARMDFAHLENGEVRNLIAKVENSYSFRLPEILHTLNAIVYNIAALLFSLLIALQFSMKYFILLALVSAPVYYLRAKYGNAAWSTYSSNASQSNYLWYLRSLFTNFQTLSEMKIYGLRPFFLDKTRELQEKVLTDYQKPIRIYTLLSSISFILIPVAIYFAINQFIGDMALGLRTIGDFTFFLNTLFTFSAQISSILINFGSVTENSLFLNDYFRLLSIENKITVPKTAHYFDRIGPREIVFENVGFTYPGSKRPSLQDISLTIHRGQNVAIVGHNGAGKSTLIKLLLRFYDPTTGRILVDGIDLKNISVEHWYKHLGVLFQDFARYFLSLQENVRFGNLERGDVIEDALVKANAKDLVSSLPHGKDQILGRWFDHGMELSGGQWQKIAIARAIYRNAPILLLDEPTSAIDADSEAEIFKNLNSLYKDQSLIFISHRFSTVRTAEHIYVLEQGKLAEQGRHEDLLIRSGRYASLFALQKKGYE